MTTTYTGTGAPGSVEAGDLAADLALLEEVVERVTTAGIAAQTLQYSGVWLGAAAVRVHRATERLAGKRLQWLLAEEADGRWAIGGARTYATHVAHTHRIGQSRAKAEVRLARQLRDEIRGFDEALRGGEIGLEQAQILARGALTSRERVEGLREPVRGEDDADTGTDEGADDGADSDANASSGSSECEHSDSAGTDDPETSGHEDDTVEDFLLGQAQRMRPEEFRRLVRHYAKVADPDADDRGYRKSQEKEHLELSRTLDGYHLRGFLTEEHGQQVCTALDALMGAPARGETRSATQRRAQALADMARVVLDQGLAGTSASVRPHLGVVMGAQEFTRMMADAGVQENAFGFPSTFSSEGPLDPEPRDADDGDAGAGDAAAGDGNADAGDAAAGAGDADAGDAIAGQAGPGGPGQMGPESGRSRDLSEQSLAQIAAWDWATLLSAPPAMWADASGPVPSQVLARLARCGDVYRVLFSPEGEVINHGRAHRLFTASQRRAIIARDRHCTFPECTAPPVLCETHHARVRWSQGGRTDVNNGALLCFHHHDLVESRGLVMTRSKGMWRFYRRDGTEIRTRYEANQPAPRDPLVPWKQRE